MKSLLIFILPVLVLFSNCSNNTPKVNCNGTDSVVLSGSMKITGSQTLYPMMVKWTSVFITENKNVKIDVRGTYSEVALQELQSNKIDIAMISRPLSEQEKAAGLWSAPVAMDAVVPIISFDNNNIQSLVMKGVSKEKLAGLFTGKYKTWEEITGKKSNVPVKVFVHSDSSGTAQTWNSFLSVKAGDVKGNRVLSDLQMLQQIIAEPGGIGYCSIMTAYNLQTGFRKEGIYILPIDYNANGTIDDNEQFYDKVSLITNAIVTGKLSQPPARELYIVTKTKPKDKLTTTFIKWVVTIGQNYMPELGYINITPEKANISIESMK